MSLWRCCPGLLQAASVGGGTLEAEVGRAVLEGGQLAHSEGGGPGLDVALVLEVLVGRLWRYRMALL